MTDHEHREQSALFDWAQTMAPQYPELALMFAIPNGGARHKATAARLKNEGVKAATPDVFLPVPRQGYAGFFIEMKVVYPDGKKSALKKEQRQRLKDLAAQGYKTGVYWHWQDAQEAIEEYLTDGQQAIA